MKSLKSYILESADSDKVYDLIDKLVEDLSTEIDDQTEEMYIPGEKLYLNPDVRVGIRVKDFSYVIGPESEMAGCDAVLDPRKLTRAEYETFVTDDLGKEICKIFGVPSIY